MSAGRKDRDALAWFADELRAHRTAHGWTQADVAAKISYSESLIAQVETCRKAATPELAKALDRVFATPGFTEDAPACRVPRARSGGWWSGCATCRFPPRSGPSRRTRRTRRHCISSST